jgi:hypothetical protein
MGEHSDKPDETFGTDVSGDEDDVGLIGGGGPASTIEPEDPKDDDSHLADTDHKEL